MKKRRPYNLRTRIVQQLRKIFFYSPLRREALERAKVVKGGKTLFRCAITKKLHTLDQVTVDHIIPVVDTEYGFPRIKREIDDWTVFVLRLFCSVENLQVISKEEHSKKTKLENKKRREYGKRKEGK